MYSFEKAKSRKVSGRAVAFLLLIALAFDGVKGIAGDDCASRYARIRSGARNAALFGPRVVQAFVYDIGNMFSRFGRDMREAPNNYARARRLLVMRRENPGTTGVLDFIRDPFTSPFQTQFVRRPLSRIWGREIQPPRTTLAELPTILGVGTLLAGGVYLAFTRPTDNLNQTELESRLERHPMGSAILQAWRDAGQFSSASEAHALFGEYQRGLRAWRAGDPPLRRENMILIEHGFFGPISREGVFRVVEALRGIQGSSTEADLEHLQANLPEAEKNIFREFLRFDSLLRSEFEAAIRESSERPGVGLDPIFTARIQATLAADPAWGTAAGYDSERRAILARALDPRVIISGSNDLTWSARMQSAFEATRSLSESERNREFRTALNARNLPRLRELALGAAARATTDLRRMSPPEGYIDVAVAGSLLAAAAGRITASDGAYVLERERLIPFARGPIAATKAKRFFVQIFRFSPLREPIVGAGGATKSKMKWTPGKLSFMTHVF